VDATAFTFHGFASGIEGFPQNRSLRFDKLLTLIDDFFKRLTGTPGKVSKIVFRATGIPPELVARFASRLRCQEQRRHGAHRCTAQKSQKDRR
jgi:hypothetical protein